MKKIGMAALCAAAILTGCNYNITRNVVYCKGDVVQKELDLTGFDRIQINGSADLNYLQDQSEKVFVKANEDVFEAYVKKHFAGLDPTVVLAEGKVEDQLLKVIDQYCADLIIIGSMSTKGLFGSLFNKPSENIIGKTRIPVMVVPNDLSLECTPDF